MNILITLLFITACFAVITCRQFRSDYEYYPNVEGWLKSHLIPATWHDAFKICDLEGAVLASPTSQKMKYVMATHIRKTSKSECPIFTGVHSTFSKGFYSSVEGIPLVKMPIEWTAGEPDNADNNEDCIILLQDGTIADVNCSDVFPYICFKKDNKEMAMTICGTVDEEYELNPLTGNCYKFHGVGQVWKDAYMTCEAEGGYLAVINNYSEAQFVIDLANKKNYTVDINSSKRVVLLGFYDFGDNGIWRTIHGQKIKEAGYSDWSPGQPDNTNPGQHCGAIHTHNNKLDDFWCNIRAPFVCEKSPESLLDVISVNT